jgi:hypothetical protein
MTIEDLLEIKGCAKVEFLNIPDNGRFENMSQPFTQGDRVALSYYLATINYLNRIGLINLENFANSKLDIRLPDSEVDLDADFLAKE